MIKVTYCKISWLNPEDKRTVYQLSNYTIGEKFVSGMAHSFLDGYPTYKVYIPINRVLLIDDYETVEEWRKSETPKYSQEDKIGKTKA